MDAERRAMEMKRLNLPIALLIIGVLAAALVAAMPQALLDVLMWRLGLPYVLSAATPPIGTVGRIVLALVVLLPFVAVATIALRQRGFRIGAERRPALANPDRAMRAPTIRRADAHPDAAPRRPIRAEEDLGPPLPMMPAPAPARRARAGDLVLPRDLDQPLAAFDPVAIPDVPRDPVRAVPPLAPAPAPAPAVVAPRPAAAASLVAEPAAMPCRGDSPAGRGVDAGAVDHDLAAMDKRRTDQPGLAAEEAPADRSAPTEAERAAAADAHESLGSLLDRLERGARQRRVAVPPPPSPAPPPTPSQPETLSDTLSMLRQMARR